MPAAPRAPQDLADAVFRVGRAYGMTADRSIYQAVAVRDGRITAVGLSRDELDSFIGPGTAVIDDPELVLYPAFNDTHNHQLLAARDLDYVSLEQARSVDELVQALRGAADRTPPGEWVISSRCWHETHLREGRLPTARERYWDPDRASQVMPVRAWVDEGALIAAGSDCNVSFVDPLLSIWGLVTRGTRTAGVQGPEYRVDTYTAIQLYTATGGRLLGEDRSVGILAPGAFADVAGFRADLLDCPVDDLPSQQPALTLVGGRPVYDPDGLLGSAGSA